MGDSDKGHETCEADREDDGRREVRQSRGILSPSDVVSIPERQVMSLTSRDPRAGGTILRPAVAISTVHDTWLAGFPLPHSTGPGRVNLTWSYPMSGRSGHDPRKRRGRPRRT